ncbi:MAG: HD domain-containing protein [Lachnospiraceae bacterium]|nr:HD domain-containing protein [Lachnospiraceae bacterium]
MERQETYRLLIEHEIKHLEEHARFLETKNYTQHGGITVYEHCINVAFMSCKIADKYHLDVNYLSLIRGALLHDYFLYDWHENNASHRLHGFRHPGTALKNATRDYSLNQREKNTIARHMFPLTPIPPQCREAWLVCLADKWCAMEETLRPAYRSCTNMLAMLSRRLPKVSAQKQ